MANRLEGDFTATGAWRFRDATLQDGAVDNAAVSASADIAVTKMLHRHACYYSQADGTDVAAAALVPIHIVYGATATVTAMEVMCVDSPEGGDKTFTVDLLKTNTTSGATPATILTAARTYPAETADGTVLQGSIDSASLVDGDMLLVTVAVSGSTGNQGQGVCVVVTVTEDAA